MRVALLSPYSLSVPGGVQGQVLGLARALRAIGVDARVIGPTDGPPPEPGVTTVGAERRRRVQRQRGRRWWQDQTTASDRTLEALRVFDPDVLHLHEPLVPGPTSAALLGSEVPKVGTFHAASENGADRLQVAAQDRGERGQAARGARGGEPRRPRDGRGRARRLVPAPARTGSTSTPTRRSSRRRRTDPTVLFCGRHEPRKGLGVLLDAWVGLDRDAELWVASDGPETEALMARRTPRVEWLGRITEAGEARPARRGHGLLHPGHRARSRSASCCSRRWRRARACSPRTSRATATSAATT